MKMEMADMKMPKKSAKEMKAGMAVPASHQDEYPYGLRVNLENEQLSKLKGAEGYEVGDTIHIMAIGTVTSKSAEDRQDGTKDRRISIQIKQIGCNRMKSEEKMSDDEYYREHTKDKRR